MFKKRTTNPFSDLGLPPEFGMPAGEALRRAGYDPDDEQDRMLGMVALAAALRVYEAAAGPAVRRARAAKVGRNDPCPCGSGRKYKKCCQRRGGGADPREGPGARPAAGPFDLVPRVAHQEGFAEDFTALQQLFQEDPTLCRVRFTEGRARAFVMEALGEEATPDTDTETLADRLNRILARYLDEVEGPEALGDLAGALLEAAPRWARDPSALRALALGVTLHTMEEVWAEDAEDDEDTEPSPLYTMILRLTLTQGLGPEEPWEELIATAGGLLALRAHMLAGERLPLEGVLDERTIEPLPEGAEEEAREFLADMARQIRGGGLPVSLPFPSLLPSMARMALVRDPNGMGKEEVTELVDASVEALGPEDAELFEEFLAHWVEENRDEADKDTLVLIASLRTFLAGGWDGLRILGRDLVVAALTKGPLTDLPGAPTLPLDAENVAEAVTPDFLERYGDFLWEEGLPEMARRTWGLCRLFGPLTPALEEKLARKAPFEEEDSPD